MELHRIHKLELSKIYKLNPNTFKALNFQKLDCKLYFVSDFFIILSYKRYIWVIDKNKFAVLSDYELE